MTRRTASAPAPVAPRARVPSVGLAGIAHRLGEPLTPREARLFAEDGCALRAPHGCWAGTIQGRPCVRPRGHYRDARDAAPSPHAAADGATWFGFTPPELP